MNKIFSEIIIEGPPVPWAAHQGFGRRSFNPRFKEKSYYQWQIKEHLDFKSPLECPLILEIAYELPIPKGTSKSKREKMIEDEIHHIKRPDLDNLNKFLLDCLKGILMKDDSQVIRISCEKFYGEKPQTVVLYRFD